TCAFLFVPVVLLEHGFAWMMESVAITAGAGGLPAIFAGLAGMIAVALLLYALVVPLTTAAATVAVADLETRGSFDWKRSWGTVARRAGPLALTLVPAGIAVLAGSMLCLLPGAVLALLFAFLPQAVLVERRSGLDAMKRSVALVRSDFTRIGFVMATFWFLSTMTDFVAGLVAPAGLAESLIGDLLYLAVLPFPVIGEVLLYFDVRHALDHATAEGLSHKLAPA
ncbi:MAG: hypothetical protein ACOC5B_02875, partial [Myxococcota bacterium]